MILLFGPQGSGKGEQASRLAKRYGWRIFSTGELLRNTQDSEIRKVLDAGIMIDDEQMARLVDSILAQIHPGEQFILDGYPRFVSQAEALKKMLVKHNLTLDYILKLNVPKEELMKRFAVRARSDDTPEAINRRLAVYSSQIGPLLAFYEADHVPVYEIDGLDTPEVVESRIVSVVGQRAHQS